MNQRELEQITQWIKEATTKPNADENIRLILKLASNSITDDKIKSLISPTHVPVESRQGKKSFITHFTRKEISKMSKTFKKEFIANGLAAHVLKRQNSKNSFIFEIRYRRNGYHIHVSGATLEKAKERFIQETMPDQIQKHRRQDYKGEPSSFMRIANEWLEFKRDKLNERTHKNYVSYCKRYIFPAIGDMRMTTIKTIDINNIMTKAEGRVYEDLRVILNSIFKYAIASGILTYNPMSLIPFKRAERNTRRALTYDEQKTLVKRLNLPEFEEYKRTFLILLYFGLRPCELEDARFEGDFLIARNAKRKGGKIEYKKIPICRQAREQLNLDEPIVFPHRTDVLNRIFKRIMNDEEVTQYYLRHTFATVCQQYVRPDIVDIWMGDSSERLVGRVYTHFPDKFMKSEMDKVVFEV